MAYASKPSDFRPETGEAPFGLDEVFFSRTDPRGVVHAGNEVFRRVAHYDWSDLIGAPHRVIRHPDMPRGVFWLLWDTIKQGKPIGAYVKNKAKDGLYYWVFAVVGPCEGGYLSARIKPTSEILAVVQREYAALLAAEVSENLTPEASAQRLLTRLAKLGYANYDLFSAQALSTELTARNSGLQKPADKVLKRFHDMLGSAERLRAETDGLIKVFHQMRTIPHNMQVIASRLEPTGGPVSTLSKNYGSISHEMSEWFESNVVQAGNTFGAIQGTISEAMFLDSMARILRECDTQLASEQFSTEVIDIENERRVLGQQLEKFLRESAQDLTRVRDEAHRILRASETMRRHVTGLSSTRVLAKIEAGRIQNAGEGLGDIIVQLGTFQDRISERLDIVAAESQAILKLID